MSDLPDYIREAAANHKLEQARIRAQRASRKPRAEWTPIAEWGPQFFHLYDTGDLVFLYEPQVRALNYALAQKEDGMLINTTVLWSWPKKSAKSTVVAMMADWIALFKPNAQIRLVANDLKQADSRVGFYLREAIRLGAKLGYGESPRQKRMQNIRKDTKISSSGYSIRYPNGAIVEMVPIDPQGEAGGNDDLIVFSELWGWKSKAHQAMWSEMTISPTRYGKAQRWVDTYAGFDGESPVLENLYSQVVKEEFRIDPDYEFYQHNGVFAAWVTVPLFPWQTAEYYAQEEMNLEPSEFRRMHRNTWASPTSAFAPYAWWEACERKKGIKRSKDEELIIAVDAATDSDCFAIWAGTKKVRTERILLENGKFREEETVYVVTRYIKMWYPGQYERFDFKEPKEEIRRLCAENNVLQVAYDRYQLKDVADVLEEEGLAWFEPFDQITERDIADKLLYDLIRQTRFIHWGEADFNQHFKNADKHADGKRMRIIKRRNELKIDGLVAASMGAKRVIDLVQGDDVSLDEIST